MALTTAITLDNFYALEAAMVEGVKVVKYSDKEVEYRSIDEMMKIYNFMRKKLCLNKTSTKKGFFGGRRINAIHDKGLC